MADAALDDGTRALLDLTPEAIIIYGEDGQIEYANDPAATLLGKPAPSTVVHRSIWEFVPPEDIAESIRENQRRQEEQTETADIGLRLKRMLRSDGGILEVEFVEVPILLGLRPATQAVIRDVTADRSRQRELRQEEEKFRKVFETSPDGVTLVRVSDGRFVEVNEAFLRLCGYARHEVIGRTSADLRLGGDTREQGFFELKLGEVVRNYETEIQRRDGRKLWALVSAIRIDLLGQPHVVSFLRDVTGLKDVERALRGALEKANQSDRLKSAFLANISHEIRTPLNVILGYTSLIVDRLERSGDTSQEVLVAGIEANSNRLTNVIRQVLDFSLIETGAYKLSPTDMSLDAVMEKAIGPTRTAAADKGLDFSFENAAPKALLRFDPDCLLNSLRNLLDNAVKFTAKGSVSVTLRRDAGKEIVIEVADTGIGIDEEYLQRMFDAFSQENPSQTRMFEGAGLGLVLAKRYLGMNGGRLSVRSVKGQGSVFTIHLPKNLELGSIAAAAAPGKPAAVTTPPRAARPLILVVEDDVATQTYMREALKPHYEVLVAATARKARRHLAARGGEIAMILMDVSLKGDEDGLTLARSLRAEEPWKTVPIIATTAHAEDEDSRAALAAGCNAYLAKPFRHRELLSVMEQFLS